ncbi:hypothetical protein OAJ50_05035 [Candidatus Nitrosopelagicus sp.]|nr:hypothetical protein [Candidatus Nitrosopelagicus sp.]
MSKEKVTFWKRTEKGGDLMDIVQSAYLVWFSLGVIGVVIAIKRRQSRLKKKPVVHQDDEFL